MGGWDAPWHWVVLALVVVVLFGYKKLPDASRSLGRSLRIFKSEIKGMSQDDKARASARDDDDDDTRPDGGRPAQDARASRLRELPPAQVIRNDAPRPRPRPNVAARSGSDES